MEKLEALKLIAQGLKELGCKEIILTKGSKEYYELKRELNDGFNIAPYESDAQPRCVLHISEDNKSYRIKTEILRAYGIGFHFVDFI